MIENITFAAAHRNILDKISASADKDFKLIASHRYIVLQLSAQYGVQA
jgi:hypothetical protein